LFGGFLNELILLLKTHKMKKLSVFLLLLSLAGYIDRATAQVREEAEISVSANVLSDLTITLNGDADFGNISATTPGDVFLDPQGTESSYVGATAKAGMLRIDGKASQSVRIGWPPSITLEGAEDDLTFTFAVSGNGLDDQSGSVDLIADGGFVTAEINMGFYYLWVGGSLGKLTSQVAGSYEGTAFITVEYN